MKSFSWLTDLRGRAVEVKGPSPSSVKAVNPPISQKFHGPIKMFSIEFVKIA
jgi:hypothetical protein